MDREDNYSLQAVLQLQVPRILTLAKLNTAMKPLRQHEINCTEHFLPAYSVAGLVLSTPQACSRLIFSITPGRRLC